MHVTLVLGKQTWLLKILANLFDFLFLQYEQKPSVHCHYISNLDLVQTANPEALKASFWGFFRT